MKSASYGHRPLLWLVLLMNGVAACDPGAGADPGVESVATSTSALTAMESEAAVELNFGAGDFDGDGRADLSVKLDGPHPRFMIDHAANGFGVWDVVFTGYPAMTLNGRSVPGDYDGDGFADLALKGEDGHWRIDYHSNGFGTWDVDQAGCGGLSYLPVPGDYDGDHKTDLGLKGDDGSWQIDYAGDGFGNWVFLAGYGWNGWFYPVPADYDGDGKTDISTKDGGGNWHIDYAANGFGTWDEHFPGFGNDWFRPVPADYDGDGRADFSTRDGGGTWYVDYAKNGRGNWDVIYHGYGAQSATPMPADYDGDDKADLAIKEECGAWSMDKSNRSQALRANVIASSSNESGGWARANLVDGKLRSTALSMGYSSQGSASNHSEWIEIRLGSIQNFSEVILYPRSDAGFVGVGFPVDFKIQVWDGASWLDRVTRTGFPQPGTPQSFKWGFTDRTDRIRILATSLRQSSGSFFMELAEVDVHPDSWSPSGNGTFSVTSPSSTADAISTTVTTAADLVSTLRSGFRGTVFIPGSVDIDLSNASQHDLPVHSCMRIKSTHDKTTPGAVLHTQDATNYYDMLQVIGHDVRIENLRLVGPRPAEADNQSEKIRGIQVKLDPRIGWGRNILIQNNDLSRWTDAAVDVHGLVEVGYPDQVPVDQRVPASDAGQVLIKRNHIHHNARKDAGYGVLIDNGAYATVYGNVFTFNRHAIAGDGSPFSGYVARYNYVLSGGDKYTSNGVAHYTHNFDMHGSGDGGYDGIAGEYTDIAFNTFLGHQSQLGVQRAAFTLRGVPTVGAHFENNVCTHEEIDDAIWMQNYAADLGLGHTFAQFNLTVANNHLDVNNSRDIAVGEFDGDGKDDVFVGTGTAWYYSSAGLSEWRLLNIAEQPASELRFGQFDDDPRTDVFAVMNHAWYYSSGGSGPWQLLRADVPGTLQDLILGDFDGNGKADVIYTNGSEWLFSADARGAPVHRATSSYRAKDLRVGDFNRDSHADVFSLANGDWSWMPSAQPGPSTWSRLNAQLGTELVNLRFADLNNDGRTDVVAKDPVTGGWRVSYSGTDGWLPSKGPESDAVYTEVYSCVFGDFNGDHRTDALRWEVLLPLSEGSSIPWVYGTRFLTWMGAPGDHFALRSLHDML